MQLTETISKTIRYEPEDLRREFQTILNEIHKQMETSAVKNSLGNLDWEISTLIDRFTTAIQGDFSLAVVGDFKRGKSTLINALLGAEVATTNVTPETIAINYIKYGTENKVEAVLEDGGRVTLAAKELFAEQLEPILKQLPPVKHLETQTPIDWLQGISLIDTPGTGDIFQRFDRDILSILERADAVIFTISALSPLSLSEQNFLHLSLLPQDFPKVFFVLNMLDCIRTDEEAQRLLDSVQTKINRLFPQARLFGISGRDEFTRTLSLSRPNPQRAEVLEEAFADFRNTLEDSILVNRDLIQLDCLVGKVERELNNWRSQIKLVQEGLQSNEAELKQAIAQCQDKSSELSTCIEQHKQQMKQEIESLSKEATKWLEEFCDRLETESIDSLSQHQITELQRHYNFFLTDSIQKAVASCLNVHRPLIIDCFSKAMSSITEELHLLKQSSLDATPSSTNTSFEHQYQWTDLDTLQTILNSIPMGFGFNPIAIANILIYQIKKSASSTKVSEYQRKLRKSLPQIRTSVIEQVQLIYQDITQQLEQEFDAIAQKKIDASLSALQQAQNLSARGHQEIATANQNLEQALAILSQSDRTLNNFQQKLWY